MSFGEDENWVDPLTNLAVLSAVDLERHMSGVLKRQLPASCFGPVVHELTHHWCFHSAVGNTLALLALRTRRRALLLDRGNVEEEWSLIDDHMRYETAIAHLRPLAEGLALFAEFDMMPGNSRVASLPMLWTWLLFGGESPAGDDSDTELQKAMWVIYRSRLSADFLFRKENLLVQPLSSAHGGYFPGYLTVKSLWSGCTYKDERFIDPDFFLTFLRSFIYDDMSLVAKLLDPNTSNLGSAWAVRDHIAARLAQLIERDLSPVAEEFERVVSRQRTGRDEPTPLPLLADDAECALGRQRYDEAYAEVRKEQSDPVVARIAHVDQWTLAQRETMCLASMPVRVRVSNGRAAVFMHGIPVLSGAALPHATEGTGDGMLSLYCSPGNGYIAVVASTGGAMALAQFLGDVPAAMREQFHGYNVDRKAVRDLADRSRAMIDDVLSETRNKVVVEVWKETLPKEVDLLYGQGAMLNVRPDRADECRAAMREAGLFQLLGCHGDTVRAAALLGLAESVGATRDLPKLFALHALDYEDTMHRLREADTLGFPLLSQEGDRTQVFI